MFIFWITQQDRHWVAQSMMLVSPLRETSNNWETYQVKLPVSGLLTNLRLDPLISPGTIDFDWIRLLAPESPLVLQPEVASLN